MFISSKNITMLAIFDTNQDISLAEINIKFTKCSNNTVAIVYSKQVVILFFECKYIFDLMCWFACKVSESGEQYRLFSQILIKNIQFT